MPDLNETFFTSIGCMDGRVQEPVAKYGKKRYAVLYPDTITEAGLVGLLANNPTQDLLESIKKKILISVEKHHSKGIVVHGHQECAALDAVEDELHKEYVIKAASEIREMTSEIEVMPVFVFKGDNGWEVQEL